MKKILMKTFALLAGGVCAYILIAYSNVNNNLPSATANDISASVIPSIEASFQTEGYTIDTEVIPRKVYNVNITVGGKSRDVVCILADISDYSFRKGIVTHCELNGHKSKRVISIKTQASDG